MKRDLKKWLRSDNVKTFVNLSDVTYTLTELSDKEVCEEIFNQDDLYLDSPDQIMQFIWCEAQKQFLKDILDDIDDSIDKMFRGKDQVRNDKAQLVAYEASLKQWLYNKYKYLQQKNGR